MPVQQNTARRIAALLALLVAACGLAVAPTPATAAPRLLAAPGDSGDDGEGGSASLIDKLEKASKGFVEAKAKLKTSKEQQAKLTAELKRLDADLGPQQDRLDLLASQAYTAGRGGPMAALLNSDSAEGFLGRAETLAIVAADQNRAIQDLKATRETQQKAKTAIDIAIKDQQKQVTVMEKQKQQAEAALKAANQGSDAGSSSDGGGSADAAPGPSGTSCNQTDPTGTGGCITATLLHAYKEARADGFTRFTKCWREQNSGEHPKGRACDFSAEKGTFGGDATGADKTYGDNLANYFINNADDLNVLYVIWYRRIWLPSSGWKSYSGAGGDPSSDHTNHVHLSVN
ncbi:coiled-coil domain-containing protein [Actinoplanes philippinensis]|uniref:coiled-coil domain-containing protein n=1 Tax=Actinoplanes philippinensis TaxID=35752 RepID=UPI00340AAE3E